MFASSILKKSRFNKIGTQSDQDFEMDMTEEEELLRIDHDEDFKLQSIFKEEELSTTNETTEDLRYKIIGLNNKIHGNQIPYAGSQQWRLLHPNNAQKQAGMPPLIQKDAPAEHDYNLNRRQNVINNNYGAKSEQNGNMARCNQYNRRNGNDRRYNRRNNLRGNTNNNRRGQHYATNNQQQFNNLSKYKMVFKIFLNYMFKYFNYF